MHYQAHLFRLPGNGAVEHGNTCADKPTKAKVHPS